MARDTLVALRYSAEELIQLDNNVAASGASDRSDYIRMVSLAAPCDIKALRAYQRLEEAVMKLADVDRLLSSVLEDASTTDQQDV